jgi:hypothetical protein
MLKIMPLNVLIILNVAKNNIILFYFIMVNEDKRVEEKRKLLRQIHKTCLN